MESRRVKWLRDIYDNNEEFRTFVDKTCRTYDLSLERAFSLKTVEDVAMYYMKKKEEGPINDKTGNPEEG